MTRPAKRNPRNANGHRRRQLRRWLAAQGRPCALCGGDIDYTLPAGHPLAFEVDEVLPVSRGGDPLDPDNVQPAHRICNQRKGNRIEPPAMRDASAPKHPADPTSRAF